MPVTRCLPSRPNLAGRGCQSCRPTLSEPVLAGGVTQTSAFGVVMERFLRDSCEVPSVFRLPREWSSSRHVSAGAESRSSPAETESATDSQAWSDDDSGCKTLRCSRTDQRSLRRACVARAMHAFVLQTVEEALRRRVVPAVALAAHRAGHAVLGQLGLEDAAGVLAARGRSDGSALAQARRRNHAMRQRIDRRCPPSFAA